MPAGYAKPSLATVQQALAIARGAIRGQDGVGYRDAGPDPEALLIILHMMNPWASLQEIRLSLKAARSYIKGAEEWGLPKALGAWILESSEALAPDYGFDNQERRTFFLTHLERLMKAYVPEWEDEEELPAMSTPWRENR